MNLVGSKNNPSMPRVPWRIRAKLNDLVNGFHYYKNKLGHSIKFGKDDPSIKSIVFENGFHGKTGSTYAIAGIANLLSKKYRVEFVSFPRSHFNPLLKKSVRIVRTKRADADLYICTVTCDLGLLEELRRDKKKVMITCHSLLNALHGLTPQRIQRALSLADKVHFVSAVQQDSFKLEDGRYFVIPNTNAPIRKRTSTRNVGMVGNLAEPRKNVKRGVEIALKAEAEFIHLWGAETLDFDNHPRIKVHGWANDKNKIFDSFDVLISLSDTETFGLVVSEALSAGMPCLLSDIPAFRQFKDCRGVELVDANDERAVAKLNGLLRNKNELKGAIFKFWQEHYSEEVLAIKWHQAVDAMFAR